MKPINEQKLKGRGNSNNSTPQPKPVPKTTTPPNPKTTSAPTKEEICSGKLVSEGMKGDVVWMINDKLQKIKFFNKNLTNDFGTETKKAVANFQNSNKDKLEDKSNPKASVVDGIVGPKTWNLLFQGTEHACKTNPTNTTTTSAKPIDTTSIPTKPKIRKPIRRFAGDDSEDNLREQSEVSVNSSSPQIPTPNEPKRYLTWAKNSGCFTEKNKINWFTIDDRKQQPNETKNRDGEMTWAITGFDDEDNNIRFFADGTFQNDSESQYVNKWVCKALKLTTSKTANPVNMDADQAKYVNDMVARGQFQTTKPSDYETNQGKWKWIDLHDMNSGLFPEPNKYFVYSQSGLMGKLKNQYPNVEKVINQTGWTLDQPDIDTEAYSTRRDIGVQFPKYTELFPNGLPIYYTGTTRSTKEQQIVSDLVKAIGTNTDSIDGKTCRDSVNVLYDALQNWKNGVRYFSGDTELELVRAYVQRCRKNYENGFNRIFAGGAKKKYDFLNRRRSGPSGELQFMIGEQKNNLNSLIKKKLFEAKEKKENNTLEKQLIENKLKMIVKSVKREGNILKK
jgi:peptidoglycan hydrolase-like protein with peptidoglycan-binding domain